MGISSALGSQALLPAGLGFRNKIINGDFRVWQRGTSITASAAYTSDRWVQVSGNSIVHTQSTDVPNAGFTYSMSLAGTGSNIAQRIESLNCGGINGSVVVSFWYKSTVGSDALTMSLYHCNTADSFGSVTQIGSNVTVASTPSSSWTYYTYTFNGVPANAKNGLALYLFRGSGATSTTLLTGVQLEANTQPTPFEQRPIGVELELCQRYYIQNNELFVVTCTTTFNNSYSQTITYPTKMRAAPTVTVFPTANLTGTANQVPWFNSTGGAGTSATDFGDLTPSGFSILKVAVPSYTLAVLCYRASIEL
jgi:hypothetical protein